MATSSAKPSSLNLESVCRRHSRMLNFLVATGVCLPLSPLRLRIPEALRTEVAESVGEIDLVEALLGVLGLLFLLMGEGETEGRRTPDGLLLICGERILRVPLVVLDGDFDRCAAFLSSALTV